MMLLYNARLLGKSKTTLGNPCANIGRHFMTLENSNMKQTCKNSDGFNIVDGILVEYLGNDSFVVIPDGVTKINDHVFLKHYVTSVSIPVSVKKISKHAFEYTIMHIYYAGTREQWNNVRKSIYLGWRMRADVVHCVDGDVELPHFDIRDNVLEHYYGAADSLVIPENVKEIDWYAFSGCQSLVSINIPDGVTKIRGGAFNHCKSLKSIVIPNSVVEIGEAAFFYCKSLELIIIPDTVKEIGMQAFLGCKSLVSVNIPAGIKEIDEYMFNQCTSLKSVYIPASVKRICSDAFSECTALLEINFAGTKKQWGLVKKDENWRKYIPASSVQCKDGSVELSQFRINDGVLEQYYGASDSVVIPNNVIEIGGFAFCCCETLLSVSIPNTVIEIGDAAFDGCKSLKSICIPEGVMEIHTSTFSQCILLESVSIPKSVRIIEEEAFCACVSLSSIDVPDGVIKIYDKAFSDCMHLASINIPASVTKIGKNAFCGCHSLKEIHYSGTEEQWNALVKGYGWNEGCTDLKVIFD